MINTYRANFIIYIIIGFCLLLSGCSESKYNWKSIDKSSIKFSLIDYEGNPFNTDLSLGRFRIYCYNAAYELLEWTDFNSADSDNDFSLDIANLVDEKDLIIYAVTLDELANLIYPEWMHTINEFSITFPSADYIPISPIYSGFHLIKNNNAQPIRIPMTRKVSNVKINLANADINQKDLYEVEIQNISAQLNIHDNGFDNRLSTIVPFINNSDSKISTDKLTIFPTKQKDGLVIILRENGKIIWTIDRDQTGLPFQCKANELLEIDLHFNSLSASVKVQPWENIDTDIEI